MPLMIKKRKLNNNELFCCTVNDIKSVFQNNDDFEVNFAYFYRHFAEDIDRRYNGKDNRKKRFAGKIVMSMYVAKVKEIQHEKFVMKCLPSANFYVLKDTEFTEVLHSAFVKDILPKMYKAYNEHKNDDPNYRGGKYCMMVELLNGKFTIHEENT